MNLKGLFHQETTLSGQGQKNGLKSQGTGLWEVNLFYIGLNNADLAVERVKQRVEKGGHGISDELIKNVIASH